MHNKYSHHRIHLAAPLLALMFCLLLPPPTFSQTFTRITATSNPIIADGGPLEYSGASWVDFDNDNDLDLFVNNDKLYRNDGNSVFVKLATNLGNGQPIVANQIIGNGNSWADYDNDGDLDCFISSATSFLYRNDGNAVFTKITSGAIGNGSANRGWACAWADYNNAGYVDLAITHPANFVAGGATPNHLLRNDGPPNYTFTKITAGPIVTGLAAYTVGTWSDFDADGDMDYFIGAGPATGATSPDYLYRNLLKETGSANFERITSGMIATDQQDGQVWNWIDYDNDGDLDAYLTNWGGPLGGLANRLYRNDNGTFTRVANDPIVTDMGISLSSVWGDYDNDGDLDLLAVGPTTALALYRNDTPGGNHWFGLTCIGTTSNRAAIGTKVRVKATINGNAVWQLREVSAQNAFNGHNSLRQHFGLGNATVIDSLKIEWPSGKVDRLTNVAVDQFLTVTEGMISAVDDTEASALPTAFALQQNYPNPFSPNGAFGNPDTHIAFALPVASRVTLTVFEVNGRIVAELQRDQLNLAGHHEINFAPQGLTSGIYFYELKAVPLHSPASSFVARKAMSFIK